MDNEFRNAHEADNQLPRPRVGQVFCYQRKSNVPKHGGTYDGCVKSIADQIKANFKTAERFGLPLTEDGVINEKPGLSGEVWWDGVNLGFGDEQREVRPEFSRLRDLIVSGECKAVIVFSQCRLYRDVAIANSFTDLCRKYGVRVYDANGLLDIWSSDGRAYIRHLASQNQHQREKSGNESWRGLDECWERNEMVVVAGKLGFRSCGFRSKAVRPVPEELEWVRWIFRAYVHGIDGRGPLGINDIARQLTADEGFVWAEDLIRKRGQRTDSTLGVVYPWQVRHLLNDERYIGKQRRDGRVTDCPAFLVDGKTAIDIELFDLAQRKLSANRGKPKGRGRTTHVFSGLVRCGACGRLMCVGYGTVKGASARVWKRYGANGYMTCAHALPPLPYEELNRYFIEELSPLIRCEMEVRESAASLSAVLSRISAIEAEAVEIERWLRDELPAYAEHVTPTLAASMERRKAEQLQSLLEEANRLREQSSSGAELRARLDSDIAQLPAAMLADLADQLIRWVGLVPDDSADPRDAREGRRTKCGVKGRLLFLTTLGIYHTAIIEQLPHRDARRIDLRLCPADEESCLGGIDELHDPVTFAAELVRTADTMNVGIDLGAVAPGLSPNQIAQAIESSKKPRKH